MQNLARASQQKRNEAFIRVQNVSKVYPTRTGTIHAVDNVSFDIAEGEFTSILGPSGCGKSTLMMMIAGLYKVSSGTIYIDGKPVEGPYTNVGIVFQRDLLMEWRTVLANVLVQAEFRRLPPNRFPEFRDRALSWLESVGLADFRDKYPFELSGGMRQRVSICRALVHDPHLLLMDEPFGALDALTREQLNMDLQRIWQQAQKTVLFITHSIPEAVFLSDRIILMGPRPARIHDVVTIDLPRPRAMEIQESAAFGKYVNYVRTRFKEMGIFN